MQNGHPVIGGENIPVPIGDPNLIRTLQYYCDLAKEGKITGVCVIGLTAEGNIYSTPTLPQNPTILQLAMGALMAMVADINDQVRAFRKPMAPSAIIKPNNGIRPHG